MNLPVAGGQPRAVALPYGLSAQRLIAAILCTSLLVAVARAFWGLNESFWIDELFTAWVVGNDHDVAKVLARAMSDTHPPAYYLSVFAFSELFGSSEIALRSFSLVCSIGALAIFYFGSRGYYTAIARLFALNIAASSQYWLYHAQNARSYGLLMILAATLFTQTLRLFRLDPSRPLPIGRLVVVAGLCLIISMTHYYGLLLALSTLTSIFIGAPRLRVVAGLLIVAILALMLSYIFVVMHPRTIFAVDGNWIENNLAWYVKYIKIAVNQSLTVAAKIALGILFVAAAVARARRRASVRDWKFDPRLVSVSVPALILIGGIVSSQIVSPNFTARNLLVGLPFGWGAFALVFDLAVGAAQLETWLSVLAAGVFAAAALAGVRWNLIPQKTPFRESARWIAARPDCLGATIPVLVPRWQFTTLAASARLGEANYGYYLDPRIHVRSVMLEDVAAGHVPAPSPVCGIVAWGGHYVNPDNAQTVRKQLEAAYRRPIFVKVFGPIAFAYVFLDRDPGGLPSSQGMGGAKVTMVVSP